ncbi:MULTISPECIES: OprO/OprP family phosphate-selective porin [Stutzerimonas stutzeri subgroup]|uniref:Porin n=1 Tax=Stutzerimonas stutzeri TaxID=316 RepID=A0A2N8RJJ4_STUST|nr:MULTISPECIES: porin [Stutzerimonas stutzeri subgroup]MCQ4252524.1 porin [Stutzerimonas stutzeri]PNF61233.1 porin [Stutzerimonas stutzeri]
MIRKHFAGFAASALALAVSAQAFAGTVTTDGADLVIKTKGGLEVGTTDKEFSFKINGRLQADADSFDGFYTQNGERADETYFRRARLEISGVAFTDWGYTFHRNFGNDSSDWQELAIHYNGWKPVQVSIGRINPTFGLEEAVSSKWITAIERSAIYDLAPWLNDHEDGEGIRVRTTVGMFHGEAGAYRQDGGDGVDMLEDEDGANNTSFVLRGVIAPIVEKDQVLHLGASFGQRDVEEGYLERIRPRLSVRGTTEDSANGNRATFGGTRTDGTDQAWGLEAAYMIGPFSVQGEYLTRTVDAMEGFEDLEATGYNVQLAYTLTGESRSYKLDGGKFDKIKPENKQIGAWEVFYRFDDITVDETGVAPSGYVGALDSAEAGAKTHTIGVNWYANESVKLSANYLKTSVDDVVNANGDDDGDAISLRAQYVF